MFSQNFLAETKLQPLEEHLHFQRFYDTAELLEGFKNVVGLEVVSDGWWWSRDRKGGNLGATRRSLTKH